MLSLLTPEIMKWDFENVRAAVRNAIQKLIKEPKLSDFQINERTLTQRLSIHLQSAFGPLFVDCEYNRMWTARGDKMKVLPWSAEPTLTDDIDGKTVYPDIIVHERGTQHNNLLVIEAKRRGPKLPKDQKDYLKLCAFTDRKEFFHYAWGAHLYFGKNENGQLSCRAVWFADAEPTGVCDDIDSC
jgi:hypothetical protein